MQKQVSSRKSAKESITRNQAFVVRKNLKPQENVNIINCAQKSLTTIPSGIFKIYESSEILINNCKKQEYMLSRDAFEEARRFFTERVANKPEGYANARDVRNYLEKAISNQATRIVGLKDVDKNILAMLEKEDLVGIEL